MAIIRANVQQVQPDNSLSTILRGLGGGLSTGFAAKAAQNSADTRRLADARQILANAPPAEMMAPTVPYSTEMTMPAVPALPAAQPVNVGNGVPGVSPNRNLLEMLGMTYGIPFI